MLHRAVACAFVEVPEKHLDKDVCTLEVNHINGKRLISNTTNLEWVTSIENIEHENINDLRPKGINHVKIKPVKGVLNRGKYKGFTFVVIGRTKLVDLGFDQPAVSNCIKGITKSHKNVSWSFATLDEIQSLTKEIPNNIKDFILNVDGNSRWEYIGKCNKTDRVISLIGKANVKAAGFSPSYLDNMFMTQNRYHRGYNWTRKEL